MKKLVLILLAVIAALTLCACKGGQEPESASEPPAFSVIQKQLKLNKRCERNESATFSEAEFTKLLGESFTYITVKALPEGKGTLVFNGSAVVKDQSIPAKMLEFLKFVPAADCANASFVFTCDSPSYSGSELTCSMVFAQGVNAPPIAEDCILTTARGIKHSARLSLAEPNGDAYTINVISYPKNGFASVSSEGLVFYTPNEGFSGRDSLVYTVTDIYGAVSSQATLSIEVKADNGGIYFADMQNDPNHLYAKEMCENGTMVYYKENGSYYFKPQEAVSKMEFLVMLMSVSGHDKSISAVADSIATDDTGLSSGLKGYIAAAADKGLITLDEGKFNPTAEITLGDALLMAAKALKLPEFSTEVNPLSSAVTASINAKIIEAENGRLSIQAVLTKAETAKLLYNIEGYMVNNNMKA